MDVEVKGSLIKFKDTIFAIIEVDKEIIDDENKSLTVIKQNSFLFPRYPIVLISFHKNGRPILYGKPELIELIMTMQLDRIPWKLYKYKLH